MSWETDMTSRLDSKQKKTQIPHTFRNDNICKLGMYALSSIINLIQINFHAMVIPSKFQQYSNFPHVVSNIIVVVYKSLVDL